MNQMEGIEGGAFPGSQPNAEGPAPGLPDDPTATQMQMLTLEGATPAQSERRVAIGPAVFDVALFIVFTAVVIAIPNYLLYPLWRGFYCNDLSIRYPVKESTVSFLALAIVSGAVIFVPVIIVEIVRIVLRNGLEVQGFTIRSSDIIIFFLRFIKYVGSCSIGLLLTIALCRLAKYTVGRLRPNFIEVCAPQGQDWDFCEYNRQTSFYVEYYNCTGPISSEKDARMSFYSGHAALAMHTAAFMAMYLQERLPRRIYCYSLRPLAQAFLIVVAVFIGITRVRDYEHFVTDVFAGLIVGFATALYSALHFARMFRKYDYAKASKDERTPLLPGAVEGQKGSAAPDPTLPSPPPTPVATVPHVYDPYVVSGVGPQRSVVTDGDSVLRSNR